MPVITLEKIRTELTDRLKTDREIRCVEVCADTLEEALADAAVQLDCKVINLEYEVVERGFSGILGLSKKPWTILAYPNSEVIAATKAKAKAKDAAGEAVAEEAVSHDKDGVFFVHHFGTDIALKVVLPEGAGRPVAFDAVLAEVNRPDTLTVDEKKIKEAVAGGTGDGYVLVGTYEHNAANDAIFVIEVSSDEMRATATINAPMMSGSDITAQLIVKALKTQGVCAGISDEKISALVDAPVYDKPVVVAEAVVPQNGKDAYIEYYFETDRTKLRAKESESGQVNYKELNQVQNVVQGQPLAIKHPAEKGRAGKTVFGRYLEADDGRDIAFPLGKNASVGEDGATIIADCNGQVLLINNKIYVEPVMEVDGVNIKTGNIDFLGKVICKGSVEDGFNIKASGNIEIMGAVGACHLQSDADIFVSQGIMGRDEGTVTCEGTLWAKFIQNTKITVGENVVVSDSLMNCDVSAQHKIILHGKKAQITGGHLLACELIAAKNIGARDGGTETILEVGIDPKAKLRVVALQTEQSDNAKKLEELEPNIATLENLQKTRRSLPKDKEDALYALYKQRDEILLKNDDLNAEIAQIQERLRELKAVGKVVASGMVYSGVKIYVREEKEEVRTEVKSVSFYYEDGFVRRGKYEEPDMSDVRQPEGYA